MAPSMQKNLVIYIKYMEFQYTLTLFQKHPYSSFHTFSSAVKKDTTQLFDEILPFCDVAQREKIQQIKNMMLSLEQMKEMMNTLEMMKEMFPEGMGGFGDGTMPDLAALSGLGEIMNIFSTLQSTSPQAPYQET